MTSSTTIQNASAKSSTLPYPQAGVPKCKMTNCSKLSTTTCLVCLFIKESYSGPPESTFMFCSDHCDSSRKICFECFDESFHELINTYGIQNMMNFKWFRQVPSAKRVKILSWLYENRESIEGRGDLLLFSDLTK